MSRFIRVRTVTLLLVMFLSFVGVASLAATSANVADRTQAARTSDEIAGATTNVFTQVYQEVSPSVVAINVILAGRGGRVIGSGTGSGFVIDHNGHIVTNDHVVDGASAIQVEFLGGTLVAADVVGVAERNLVSADGQHCDTL